METQTQQRMLPSKSAGLTNILNRDERVPSHTTAAPQLRDSGFYSTHENSSKHTSAASFTVTGLSPTGSGYSSVDKTPSPVATNMIPQSIISPSASNMSVASMVSPNTTNGVDQRRFDRPISLDTTGLSGATLGEGLANNVASRRESVDSRINQGFSDMRLGNSPYASNNQSTSSIQNTLHSQRNPRPGLEALAVHRISNGYQPSADRNPDAKIIRTAPTITGPTTGHIARAAEPTKGQAWAFPEDDLRGNNAVNNQSSYDISRRSSVTESIASSQFTTESRLPPGQRRLDDGSEFSRMNSSEFPPVHHHTMQHKQLSDLQAEESSGTTGSQPYSRTPELRVSHKLAERKRRTEMKELFDQLRDLMPQERGSKASKWEILTKAIAEHQRQADHIRVLQSHYNTAMAENDMLRRELSGLRMESSHLLGELNRQQAPPPGHPSQPASYSSDPYASAPRTELPPLRSISNGIPNGPDSMTGVQYEAPRANGYRPERY
ncbi:hlh transcription factor hpa3 [Trichoderma arundinaceum]|uniref:Hlh transcription factor hpa3 n=1 Tax=Trichoderma arundinaceum TaxID=490622 RepID=A0A395NI38_TRIAR|nr:hlh transcription factor hpa3 [Trichoderma arundinaceum]